MIHALESRFALALGAILVLATGPLAAQDPTTARAFSPEKVYDYSNLDSVNLFNGNLNIRIPIGQSYRVSPQLTYGLTLSYNTAPWDEYRTGAPFDYCGSPEIVTTLPHFTSNAGMGWSLGLGRLFPTPDKIRQLFMYESPDGGEHILYWPAYQQGVTHSVTHSTDNSHIRLRVTIWGSPDEHNVRLPAAVTLEFPDGRWQSFTADLADPKRLEWRMSGMGDRLGNAVDVVWDPAGMNQTFTDPLGRKTVIHYGSTGEYSSAYSKVITSVDVPAFSLPGETSATATYTFGYQWTRIQPQVRLHYCDPLYFKVPLLQSVILPDGSAFQMSHPSMGTSPNVFHDPYLQKLTLPTKGEISYVYGAYELPGDSCTPRVDAHGGVTLRSYKAPSGPLESWSYKSELGNSSYPAAVCQVDGTTPPQGLQEPFDFVTTTVRTPAGAKEIHYFSVFQGADPHQPPVAASPAGFRVDEFGLSINRAVDAIENRLHLSSEIYDCRTGTCPATPDQSIYTQFEDHGPAAPMYIDLLPKATRTIYNNDLGGVAGGAVKYVDVTSSDYDGYGHYRRVVTSGNFGLDGTTVSRTVTTNYNGADADVGQPPAVRRASGTWNVNFLPYAAEEQWILDTYTSVTVEENGFSAKQLFYFDSITGRLRRQRILTGVADAANRYSGTALGANDIVIDWTATESESIDGHVVSTPGFPATETRYGGDLTPLSSAGSPLTTISLTGGKSLQSTWRYGTRATAKYDAASYLHLDQTIDRNTGLPSSSVDPEGRVITYRYNNVSQLTSIALPDGTTTSFVYTPASSSGLARVEAKTTATGSSAVLRHSKYAYDAFGRVSEKRTLLPDGIGFSLQKTAWNILGWKLTESVVGADNTSPAVTSFTYDAFGRVLAIAPPDARAHQISYAYDGARKIRRTESVGQEWNGTAVVESEVTTGEEYDPFGRLVRVTQPAGDSPVTTASYGYDVAGRLTDVSVSGSGGAQPRTFRYDNRGLLRKEQHPEADAVYYSAYDAFGQLTRSVTGAVNGKFDLSYEYDTSHRLRAVRQTADSSNFLKQFIYDALPPGDPEGSYTQLGAMVKSERRNDATVTGIGPTVAEYFNYDAVGRLQSKKTVVSNGPSFLQSYTYDSVSDLLTVKYPAHATSPAPRIVQFDRTAGFLKDVLDVTNSSAPINLAAIGYSNSGWMTTVSHRDGTSVDTYEPDPSGLPRPKNIKFDFTSCTPPLLSASEPADRIQANDVPVTLSITPPSGTVTYQWYRRDSGSSNSQPIANANSASYDIPLLYTDASFFVRVSNGGCASDSRTALVTRVCDPLVAATEPTDRTQEGNTPITLSVSPPTGTVTYQWYQGTQPIANATSSSFMVPLLSANATFWVRVSKGSCVTNSRVATVTYVCNAPVFTSVSQAQNPNGTTSLSASTTGTSPITVKWYRSADGVLVGTGHSVSVGPLAVTTSFYAVASSVCNPPANATIKVEVPLPTPSNVVATRTAPAVVRVSWNAVSGAATYVIQRRHGGGWSNVGNASAPATVFNDGSVAAASVYVYRIYALDVAGGSQSAYSNGDVATTIDFLPVTVNMFISASHFNQMLTEVNAARAAAGWPSLNWTAILPAGQAAPAPDGDVLAAHLTAPRQHLDLALQALGVGTAPYTDPAPAGADILALHVTEFQGRVQ